MRSLILSVFILALFYSCSNNTKDEEINYFRINKIKRVEKYMYTYKFGKVDSTTKELDWVDEYDTLGNVIKYMYFTKAYSYLEVDTSDGKKIDSIITTQKFDKRGNIISAISFDKDGKITSKTEYTYNDSNKLVDYVVYDSYGSLDYKSHNEYDSKGKLTKSTSINTKENDTKITTIIYDGDLSKEIKVTDKNLKLISKNILVTHNDSLNVNEEYDSTNKPILRNEYKLRNKLLISNKQIDLRTNITSYEYVKKYNDSNLVTEEISYSNGEPTILYKYVYYKY